MTERESKAIEIDSVSDFPVPNITVKYTTKART